MPIHPPQAGENGTEPGQLMGVTPNTSNCSPQGEHENKLVHRNAANGANKEVSWYVDLKIVRKTVTSMNKK